MPFRFNPFTDKLDIVDTTDGPGPVISLTGNDAVQVFPISGNIDLIGAGGTIVTGNAGTATLTITVSGSGMSWSDIAASQTLVSDNGYFCTAGGALALSLPAASAVGDTITVSLDGSTSWQITQGVGQTIRIGSVVTTSGVGGSLTSTAQGDTVELTCSVANLRWNVVNFDGNITVV